jgi:hypothetical protein
MNSTLFEGEGGEHVGDKMDLEAEKQGTYLHESICPLHTSLHEMSGKRDR